MKNKYFGYAIALSGITLLGASAMYAYANYKELDNIDFEILPPKSMPKYNNKKFTVNLPVKIINTTDFGIYVYDCKLHLIIDDVCLGYINLDQKVKINKNGYSTITIAYTFDVDATDILNKSLKFSKLVKRISAREMVTISIDGTVTVGFNKILKNTIPFSKYECTKYNILGDVTEQTTYIIEYDELSEKDNKN